MGCFINSILHMTIASTRFHKHFIACSKRYKFVKISIWKIRYVYSHSFRTMKTYNYINANIFRNKKEYFFRFHPCHLSFHILPKSTPRNFKMKWIGKFWLFCTCFLFVSISFYFNHKMFFLFSAPLGGSVRVSSLPHAQSLSHLDVSTQVKFLQVSILEKMIKVFSPHLLELFELLKVYI